MPSLIGMNIHRRGMGGKNPKKDSGGEFWRRYQGAKDKGYPRDQAAAIADSEQVNRQQMARTAQRLRERLFPHLRQPGR